MNMNHNRHGRKGFEEETPQTNPHPSPPPPQISIRHLTRPLSSLSLVTPCSLLPSCDTPEDDWGRVRFGTLTMYAFMYAPPLVTSKNLSPLFQPIRRETKTHLSLHRVLLGSFDCPRMLCFTFFTFY